MKIAYFDCFSGAAGDMIVAAMLDAGLDEHYLRDQIASLAIEGLQLHVAPVKRSGISAIHFGTAAGHQHHRGLSDILAIIGRSSIPDAAKQRAVAIFERLARVEGKIHGKDPQEIHFHEVGAVDSIVDIVAACAGFDALGIEKVCCSPLSVGGGMIHCAHGIMPAPAPATVELLKEAHAPVRGGPVEAELLTPTAAAIIAETVSQFGALPPMRIGSIGYGAGTKEFEDLPNVLRLILGSTDEKAPETDVVCLLECNIDDADGETLGHAVDLLLKHGALDAFTAPVYMKHNRPAVTLSILAEPEKAGELESIVFNQGLTLGIRKRLLERSILKREYISVRTEYGPIRIKLGFLGPKQVFAKPEYADCAAAAAGSNVSLKKVHDAALSAYLHTPVG
ncbi:MAG: nickel pincer cofactor biosynthesis protein LarC [Phycisphaerae bacterium]|nr:nickel pincer cofactor biosynthesis protein LarC [Phycisphaerae bacterium]